MQLSLLSTLLAAATLAHAVPTPDTSFSLYFSMGGNRPSNDVTPTQPPSTLPASNLTLKYVTLGLGTQNYTCGTNASAAPVAVGAKANLYDLTPFARSAYTTRLATSQNATCAADKYDSAGRLRQIGVHYFTAAGTPTFDLSLGTTSKDNPAGDLLSAKKLATAPAPADACHGRDGMAAVAWLQLADNGLGATRGLKQVYRILTTGGSAPATCAGKSAGPFTQDYAAEYWFYD